MNLKLNNMDIFEEAKLALRKHLKENKKQVRKDLKKMRKMSSGEIAFIWRSVKPTHRF